MMQGRVHYYEGYSMEDVVLPTRVMGLLGAQRLILTNAAGGIGPDLAPGDLMLLTDHVASFVPSPLLGAPWGGAGAPFPGHDPSVFPPAAGAGPGRGPASGIPFKAGGVPANHRAPV